MRIRTFQSGFTLIELLVTVAIAAILLAVAVPNFSTMTKNKSLAKANNEVIGMLRYARNEAIKRGNRVQVAQSDGTTWTGGVTVWFDDNSDGDYDSDTTERDLEVVVISPRLPASISLSATANSISFSPDGMANAAVTFTLCDDRAGETGREISLLISGLVASSQITCS